MSIYNIKESWYHLEAGQVVDTHSSEQQIYLDLMVETGKAEILEGEDLKKYNTWLEEYDYVEWEDFKENYQPCNICETFTDDQCVCYAR